jgi:hypothetical protein
VSNAGIALRRVVLRGVGMVLRPCRWIEPLLRVAVLAMMSSHLPPVG